MDVCNSPWHGRTVLVTGCTGFLGGAVTRELVGHRARVVGLVQSRSRGAKFAGVVAPGQLELVHGRVEDTARLHAIMAVHEVAVIFHFVDSERGLTSVTRAAGLYHSQVPVITARPAAQLRIVNDDPSSAIPRGTARFGQLFGPRDHRLLRDHSPGGLLSASNDQLKSTGGSSRDFVFVRDAARACLALAEAVSSSGRALDSTFRSGWELTDAALRNMLANVLAGNGVLEETTRTISNPYGWQPKVSLSDALCETAEWYQQTMLSNPAQTSISLRRAA